MVFFWREAIPRGRVPQELYPGTVLRFPQGTILRKVCEGFEEFI
jgi:hypothetical protein